MTKDKSDSYAKENGGTASSFGIHEDLMEPSTQPSQVLSAKKIQGTQKKQKERRSLKDLTNLASNLSSHFTSSTSTDSSATENVATPSSIKVLYDRVYPSTQPDEVLSSTKAKAAQKKPKKIRTLQDVTNVASNLSSHFTSPSSTDKNVSHQRQSPSTSFNECVPTLEHIWKRKSVRLHGLLNNNELTPPPRKRLCKSDVIQLELPPNINVPRIFPEQNRTNQSIDSTGQLPSSHLKTSRAIKASKKLTINKNNSDAINLVEVVNYDDIEFNLDFHEVNEHDDASATSDEEQDMLASLQPLNEIENYSCLENMFCQSTESEDYIDEGDLIHACKYCGALFWYNERAKKDGRKRIANTFLMCCLQGKVQLPTMKAPPAVLHRLFYDKNWSISRNFHANIRQYNNMFSFTSMGGKIDHSKNSGRGPYSFVLSGMNYHRIGSLLPREGARPVYSQLYIYDTENEVRNRIAAVSKHEAASNLDAGIVEEIKKVLDEVNPFVKQYHFASSHLMNQANHEMKLCLMSTRQHDGRTYNMPTASEVAALIVGDIDMSFNVRDIIVEKQSGYPKRINELHASYLPLQYPILLPFGEDGYRDDIQHREETLSTTKTRKMLSIREFFAFRLMTRENEISMLLHASRLFQQFIVDGYTMVEAQRLHWVRTHQKELRVDLYQGLSDEVIRGETNASSTGKRIILPATFTGGARYMLQNYQDAMAICRWAGYPDIFLTFTCNPAWPEITRFCKKHSVSPSDRPDMLSRIFRLKLQRLMKTLKEKKIFGAIRAEVYTIEFQKRGLPHAHILLFLEKIDKISLPEAIDNVITAEIPDKKRSPALYELVKKFMIHGPCGSSNPKSPCMKDQKCSKHFPKRFNDHTTVDDDGYPTYRRRDDGRTIEVKGIELDNRFVVPYNPSLLQMFQAHTNVERCNQSSAIKYLFKYISKGNDRVVAGIFDKNNNSNGEVLLDEIKHYYNCRYISACEGSWRIFGFPIHYRSPSVERLSFHLPNQQFVIYSNNDDVSELLDKPRVCESQFLAWMKKNAEDDFAATLTYAEFPHHYVYKKDKRLWKLRQKGFSVGKIANASPSSGELYYLCILLTKVRGPKTFDDIKTVDGVIHESFRAACDAIGLLNDDQEYINAIKEASLWGTGITLRKLFVSMLLANCLERPNIVWNQCSKILSEDLLYIPRNHPQYSSVHISDSDREDAALKHIDEMLNSNGKSLQDYPSLPIPTASVSLDMTNNLILQEMSYDKVALHEEAISLISYLNAEQRLIFDKVISSLESTSARFFFVHGYGGTGKTFLWNALTSTLRAKGHIVLTVASSGIAATLLPAGRTAHSRFAIPIQINEYSVCSIRQNSALANLLISTKLIIWDEAPMVQRYCIEAFDFTLRDIMHSDMLFGGKCIVMGGDFRQILPVVPKGNRATIVNACISSSPLWDHTTIFHLTRNMRLTAGRSNQEIKKLEWFSKWLLDVGDGNLGSSEDGIAQIEIPKDLLVPESANPIHSIVLATYNNLEENLGNNEYFNDRAILAPTIEMVSKINDYLCSLLPGQSHEFLSCDTVCKSTEDNDSFDNLYTTEFLNTISSSGLPPHNLTLKVGAPIMLLRNIDQSSGLCNGTRLRISKLGKNVIEAITLNESNPNKKVFIHRMDMNPSESRLPFHMRRRQFPINLSFAMTINKSQGQSLRHVGLHLSKHVFTHGQLYVALSRVKSMDGLKIYVPTNDENKSRVTKNVVYKEVFRNLAA